MPPPAAPALLPVAPPLRPAHWLAGWLALAAAGCAALGGAELARIEAAFARDAQIAHRLLSQRAAQHDAVLATLALLQPAGAAPDDGAATLRRLSAVYPQILDVARRPAGSGWPPGAAGAALAEAAAGQAGSAALAPGPLAGGRLWLARPGAPASYALQLDLAALLAPGERPAASGLRLTRDGEAFVLADDPAPSGVRRLFLRKRLASASQPLDLEVSRTVGWAELPWGGFALIAAGSAAVLAGLAALHAQRRARQRAEALLRLGQVARLNALGELAAGLAHELNQPLAALSASAGAAARLLDEEPPDLATARGAMAQAVAQARRAAEVLARLRRAIERPGATAPRTAVPLAPLVDGVLDLLQPECRTRQIVARRHGGDGLRAWTDRVALEQILHNLATNALQALESVPADERTLDLRLMPAGGGRVAIEVADSGCGIAPEALPRLFEPFFTTRPGGLGLGLSLCETLAGELDGRLTAAPRPPRGAVFRLELPGAPDGAAADA